jgi:hypothetical protein
MAPILIAIATLAKQLGFPKKYIPIINLIMGIVAALVYMEVDTKIAVFNGVITALAASGVYDVVKKSFKPTNQKDSTWL